VAREAALPVKNRLKVLRAERDWSQQDLADHLGVSRQTINAIETEKYDPSLPLALKMGRLFEQCVEKIFLDPDSDHGSAETRKH
jgi:putative transcriptional regulator